jgi:polyphosphate kinase 2 (PPK2 family)
MLEKIDLTKTIHEEAYRAAIPGLRTRLYMLQRHAWEVRLPTIMVFEGWGASGRGAMVNFVTQNLEPRVFRLHMILDPRTYELGMPWLWRFWVKLPNYGEIAIFDQSWYRRVLVDRVEKRVRRQEWQRAFEDINDFERALADDGHLIIKFFLHISKQEQARRLLKQIKDPISRALRDPEDQLQQKHYSKYLDAIEEMMERTETEWAPWTIVEADDARFARVKVFESAIQRLTAALKQRGFDGPLGLPVAPADSDAAKVGHAASDNASEAHATGAAPPGEVRGTEARQKPEKTQQKEKTDKNKKAKGRKKK